MSVKKVVFILSFILMLVILAGTLIYVTSAETRYTRQLSLGEKYLLELEYEKAVVSFNKAIQIDPKSVESRLGLAKAYIGLEKFEDARLALEAALEIGSNNAEVQLALAKLLQFVQNKEDADSQPVVKPTEEPLSETVNPTATPEIVQAKYILPLSKYRDYILPDSDSRLLTQQDLSELWIYQIALARNEIYARHGCIFPDEYTQSFFESQAWYKKNPGYNDTMLNDYEKQNAQFLQDSEITANKGFYTILPGEVIDLNGDGTFDKIKLDYTPDDYSDFRLTINDTSIESEGGYLDGLIYVCNIDGSDPYKAIAITDAGPSDDYQTYFFYYDGTQIHSMGKIGGADHSIIADGSGILTTKERGNILHTWFYTEQYRLSAYRRLEAVPSQLYTMKALVRVINELPLQKSSTDPSISVTLHPGEDALIYATDDKEWLLIVNQDGIEGWLAMERYSNIRGTDHSAGEFFEGLNYAD